MSIIFETRTAPAPGADERTQIDATQRPPWLSGRRVLVLLLGGFAISRALYAWAGIRFDSSWLESSWQLVDPELLHHQLLSSVWFEHTQPPLFNLFVGVVLRWSPISASATFTVVYLALGVALTLALYDLLVHLGASRVAALITTLVVVTSPAAILYENALLYEYPTAVLLTVALACAARFFVDGRVRWLTGFTTLAAAAVLTRSLLHPLWFVLMVALALACRRAKASRRRVFVVVALPAFAIVAILVKNQVLYGQPNLSSWFGMNLAHATVDELPPSRRDALVDAGTLSSTAHQPAFQPYASYAPWVQPCQVSHPGIGVLDQPTKSDGSPNFNYECYLPIDQAFEADALTVTRTDPADVARTEAVAAEVTLMPSDLYPFSAHNQRVLDTFDPWYRRIGELDVRIPALAEVRSTDALRADDGTFPLSLTALAAVLASVAVAVKGVRGWRGRRTRAVDASRLLVGTTVVFVLAVGTFFEVGENYRIRYVVEPLMLACLGLTIDRLVARWSARRYLERNDEGATC